MIRTAAKIASTYYEMGELVDAQEIIGGYCNRSFGLVFEKGGQRTQYLVRRYHPKTKEKEIKFEHALVGHLRKNNFDLVAGVIPNKTGGTYVNLKPAAGRQGSEFWAVFEFLEGEDRYTWTDTHIAPDDMISAAKVLAKLHLAGCDFHKPLGADRVQPAIMDFLPTLGAIYTRYARRNAKTEFDGSFLKNLEHILNVVDQTIISKSDLKRMPQLPIHCDYHQGNLKYKGSQVCGVFDFDWSKIDLRLFDLCLALVYFCACWAGPSGGSLDLDKCKLFLKIYNDAWALENDGPGPLTRLEKTLVPTLLAAANLFVLHWTILDYYTSESPDVGLYLKFLNQGLGLMNWIAAQKAPIERAVAQAFK